MSTFLIIIYVMSALVAAIFVIQHEYCEHQRGKDLSLGSLLLHCVTILVPFLNSFLVVFTLIDYCHNYVVDKFSKITRFTVIKGKKE